MIAGAQDSNNGGSSSESGAYREAAPGDVVAYPPFPKNERGMTYGSGQYIDAKNPGPDLLSAYGTDGTLGFIRATDRANDEPEGLVGASSYSPRSRMIPLYAKDGVTVIGEFEISAPITDNDIPGS